MNKPDYSVIVFQMGKVGSKTVQESLVKTYEKTKQSVDVYHSHILCGFDRAETIIRNERLNPQPSLMAIENGKKLQKLIEENPSHQWKIISLVRDPVARNVSTFFDNLDEFVPGVDSQNATDPGFIEKLQHAFLDIKTIHSEPYRWFDEQMLPVFGVDVFSENFPHNTGYKLYNSESKIPVMIIRLEDLSLIGPFAMKNFLDLDNFQVHNTNISENKEYANLYHQFKKFPLPEKYIKEIYETKLAYTFYTRGELDKFKGQWLHPINDAGKTQYKSPVSTIPSQYKLSQVNTGPILIYQMGKVGSVTIQATLEKYYRDSGIPSEIYRVHLMNVSDKILRKIQDEYENPEKTLGAIRNGILIRQKFEKTRYKPWKVISLVREPVARNIATFFQSIEEFIPNWKDRLIKNNLSIDELQDIFLNTNLIHNGPNNWFDNEIKAMLDVDVYATKFHAENGYKIYDGVSKTPLLIIRLENINDSAQKALNEFLGINIPTLINANIGEKKEYADLYKKFKNARLPINYIEKMYSTRYARHFYTELEIEDFIKKWTRSANSAKKNMPFPSSLQEEIIQQEKDIRDLETKMQEINARANSLESQLQEIRNSLLFKLVNRYRLFIEKILPYGTLRRRVYSKFVLLIRRVASTMVRLFTQKTKRRLDGRTSFLKLYGMIVVYTLGKVGSTTMYESLIKNFENSRANPQIHHIHTLNDLNKKEEIAIEQGDSFRINYLREARALRNMIETSNGHKIKIISMVREPVARNVGAFFENLDRFIPDWRNKVDGNLISIFDIQQVFLKKVDFGYHHYSDRWFDIELKPLFDIDIYSTPFPHKMGYKMYSTDKVDVLVIRLEDLNNCVKAAMASFLNFENFELYNTNIGNEKDYAEVYKAFKQLPLPDEYVNEMYSMKYSRHFYSEDELYKLKGKWTGIADKT